MNINNWYNYASENSGFKVIFSLSLVITICATFCTLYQSWSKKSLLNPHLIYWIVTIYTIYLPALSYSGSLTDDNYFNFIFLFGSLGGVLGLVLIPIRPAVLKSKTLGDRGIHPLILLLALIYGMFLLSSIASLINSHGGIFSALIYSRLDIYLGEGIKKGAGWKLLMLLPEVCYYLVIAYSLNKNKVKRSVLLTALVVIFYVFTANTRLPIIFPIAILSILYIHKFHAKSIRLLFPAALCLGMAAIMIFSVVGSYLRNGQLENMDLSVSTLSTELVNRQDNQLGYYDWIHDLYEDLAQEKYPYEYGVGIFYYPVISFIPRAFWHSKPNTSSSNRLTELVYDRKIGDGQPIHTFHLMGDGFYQFAWVGAFLYPFLFIYLVSLMQVKVATYVPNGEYWQVYLLMSSVPFVRAELPVVKLLLTFLTILLVYQIQRVRYRYAK